MTDIVLLHHAQGLTPGVHAFADELRAAGHQVTTVKDVTPHAHTGCRPRKRRRV